MSFSTTNAGFDAMMEDTFTSMRELRTLKGAEYAGTQEDDCLANFRRNGKDIGLPMEVIWRVYAGKHWDAVSQYVRDIQTNTERKRLEDIEGRIDDLLVYLLLFKAMTKERSTKRARAGSLTEVSVDNMDNFLKTVSF